MELKQRQVTLTCNSCILLIVPYGIETNTAYAGNKEQGLLIVPYGIETSSVCLVCFERQSFNRTLWN